MDTVKLRKVAITDVKQLQQIGTTTFSQTFSPYNTTENMNAYLEKEFAWEKLTAELNNPNSIFYFAILDENIIGYLKLNVGQAQTELTTENGLEIERIYVLKEYHGKKVGQLLFDKALEIAKDKNVEYTWLGVWEENTKAVHFYIKNGFSVFDKHIFKLGNEEQTDIMMKRTLK